MDIRIKINKKKQKQIHTYLRAAIQVFFFILLPSAFTAAFAGVKYLFTQIGMGEKIGMTSFVTALLLLCLYTVVFGRFFCGFACAFGSLGDALHGIYVWICKKRKKKPWKPDDKWTSWMRRIKYLVLTIIVLMCFAGVYGRTKGISPWEVFSMLRAGNWNLKGYLAGIVILLLFMAGMCVQERFFCRFFCPMGAVFSLLPVLPFFTLARNRDNCVKGCAGCTKKCPASLELSGLDSIETSGECFQCQKCMDICPKGNVRVRISKIRGNEIWFTLVRALLLAVLLFGFGVA